ncbi:hypothetical protein BJX70DRAFT_400825 [Aspergillus crustosus]
MSYAGQWARIGESTGYTGLVFWATFQVKYAVKPTDYIWKQPSIFVNWEPATGRQTVFFIDFIPSVIQKDFLRTISTKANREANPFVWNAAFTRRVMRYYRNSFERLQESVQRIERSQNKYVKREEQPPDFHALHDIARHIIHLGETIGSAEHTIQCMLDEQLHWRNEDPDAVAAIKLSHLKWIHSLKMKSRSLSERHTNQTNLAYHTVSSKLGLAALKDSDMMKTIAAVSLVYLPGTFVSGVFGTNFFSFQSEALDSWATSSNFWVYWVYWAVTIPLTLTTILVWVLWNLRPYSLRTTFWGRPKGSNRDIPSENKSIPHSLVSIHNEVR